jgi:hypothetical protein
LARINNATQRTVSRVTKQVNAQGSGVIEEDGRVVIDQEMYTFPTSVPGRILTIREAARSIGMPVSVLHLLRERGIYDVVDMSPGLPGFHERDVDRFKDRVKAASRHSASESACQNSVVLSDVLRGRTLSCEEKCDLISALFAGRLSCSPAPKGEIYDLLVPEIQICEYIDRARQQSTDINAVDACSLLHCDFDTLRALISTFYVRGERSGGKWMISRSSVMEFSEQYAPLAKLAVTLGTCSRKIERICCATDIAVVRLTLRSGRARLYARRKDIHRVTAILEQEGM